MRHTFPYALALVLVATLGASSSSFGANPFPSSSPNATQYAADSTAPKAAAKINAYQGNIYITIANGAGVGSDNGDVSPGTQTLLIPAGKRLVVQSASMYRSGAGAAKSTIQIFVNTNVNGTYASYALPLATDNGANYAGATLNGTFYADGGTELLANAFRNNTTGAENVVVSVTGYLVPK
jgi:hypothetical protein